VLDLPIQLLDLDLPMPAYAHPGDAGLDLVARIDAEIPAGGGRALVPTGIAIALPFGYAGLIMPRSGLALKFGITVANAPGLVDCGYRDELKVILLNTNPTRAYQVTRGDRIAQLVVQRVEEVRLEPVDDLGSSARGTGGFGSSGR
jgi:dUTP pyrophosphatase